MGKVGAMGRFVQMMVKSSYGMTSIVYHSLHPHPHLQCCPKVVTMRGNGTQLVSLKVLIAVGVGLEHIVVWMAK